MKKGEWQNAYRVSQEDLHLSDEAKKFILSKANQEGSYLSRSTDSAEKHKSYARSVLLAAACFAVLALFVGILGFGLGQPDEDAVPGAGFVVQAYAAGTDTILEMGNESQIFFDAVMPMFGIEKEHYLTTEGYYTGCYFRVKGEHITRLQAAVSTGALYRHDSEMISAAENPERFNEALEWKPSRRGMGEYFGTYDDLEVLGSFDDLPKDSPEKQWKIGLNKKLGSTIDIPLEQDSVPQTFGFWTNEDFDEVAPGAGDLHPIIDLFDGATLTVTATFADGATSTQIIELHTGDVRSSVVTDADGDALLKISPELISAETAESLELYDEYAHILYGMVKETNSQPFPLPLDKANNLADTVGEPYQFERRDPIEQPLYDEEGKRIGMPIDDSAIHAASDSVKFEFGDDGLPFTMSNLSLQKSKSLPQDISLEDLSSGLGTWDYFNRVVEQVDGYTIAEDGNLTKGFSWVLMEATLTNDSSTSADPWLFSDGAYFGTLAIRDQENYPLMVLCRSFALNNAENAFNAPLAPNETRNVKWLLVVPDEVLNNPSLIYQVHSSPTNLNTEEAQAFSLK